MAAGEGGPVARARYLLPSQYAGFNARLPDWLTGAQAEENALPKETISLIVHGRTSTNASGLDHCHPFFRAGKYLAHNGVLNWLGADKDKPKPLCDSEQFLEWRCAGGTYEEANKSWSGYGAIAELDRYTRKLTVAVDGTASLYVARRARSQGWAFATSAEQLTAICRAGKVALNSPPLKMPLRIVELNAGKMTSSRSWAGFGTRQWTQLDSLSMGEPQWTQEKRIWKNEKLLFGH